MVICLKSVAIVVKGASHVTLQVRVYDMYCSYKCQKRWYKIESIKEIKLIMKVCKWIVYYYVLLWAETKNIAQFYF